MTRLFREFFNENQYLEEFVSFLSKVSFTDRNPLNTEMFFLWCMIRSTKPKVFIESGTFKGYSANFICEALSHNDNDAKFITFGFNLENCLPFALERLKNYPFAQVVMGDSRQLVAAMPKQADSTAFFIDGPKGRNMIPLFRAILARFTNIQFIAIHDCQKESGSRNRWHMQSFFSGEFSTMFCDSKFQDNFSYLDKNLIGKSELVDWKPYSWNGQKQDSYGSETGYVLPMLGQIGTPVTRLKFYAKKWFIYRLYPQLKNVLFFRKIR